jgi:ankyrin repeat protein
VSTRSLPPRPNLDQLKRQAHELQRARGDDAFTLADAQRTLAREYGFPSWAQLKHHVEAVNAISPHAAHPRFAEALAAFDAGDVATLRQLLASEPALVRARTNLDPQYGYFAGATLLHHVAGNPWRDNPLPKNIVEIATVLLDAGSDVHARTLGTNGGDTMGLLVTSKQANDAGVTEALMDVLLSRGARLDVTSDDALDASLANHAPRAAEKMIALGAKADVLAAAALGRLDRLRAFFDEQGHLRSRPRRNGVEMAERDAIGLALLYAYVRGQREAADFLIEKDGNWDVTGVNNGTALHRAAFDGDLDMVRRLVARGADIGNRDNPFMTTPLGWADHNEQADVMVWLRAHCVIDLHDAVTHGFDEHIEARIRENPSSVNGQRDHGEIPGCAPLHCAAYTNRDHVARILLAHGADPNVVSTNGVTPLDVADYAGATGVIRLLEEHGGRRTAKAEQPSQHPRLEPFERLAADIAAAYNADEVDALQRIQAFLNRRVTFHELRTNTRSRLQKDRDFTGDISVAQARDVVAGLRGFASWGELVGSVTRPDRSSSWGRPPYTIDEAESRIELRHGIEDADWDAILQVIADRRITRIETNGQLTDAVVERLVALDHVTHLNAGNSKRLTDKGVRRLAGLPQLQSLDLSNCGITDDGLEVLRDLGALTTFALNWDSHLSDGGLANLTFCDQLEEVNLMGSHAGDGVINALTAKRHLRRVTAGVLLSDAGMPLFQRFPAFKTWSGERPAYSVMSFSDGHTNLMLDGPVSNDGLRQLAGLEGLSGLSFFWHARRITPDGLAALGDVPNLGLLGCGGELCNDVAMRHIAAMPNLRMLQAQGTVATDAGFEALSRSRTIEYIWGRECPNLSSRGFAALASMPALKGLAVSCKDVDDAALALLPRFPSLTELMPMDVTDEGFRHIGACENLERLWCMYCRDTTDAATEHIAGLPALRTYYAGQTKITDRSLKVLSGMASLETLEFWNCAGITSAGVAGLAALTNLRELIVEGCRQVSPEAAAVFPAHVHVRIAR